MLTCFFKKSIPRFRRSFLCVMILSQYLPFVNYFFRKFAIFFTLFVALLFWFVSIFSALNFLLLFIILLNSLALFDFLLYNTCIEKTGGKFANE